MNTSRLTNFLHNKYRGAVKRYHMHMSSRALKKGTSPRVHSSDETLSTLLETGYSFSRLGDGEFLIIFGQDINYQRHDAVLAKRLLEVVREPVPNHIVGVNQVFGPDPGRTAEHKAYWRDHLAVWRHGYLRAMDLRRDYYEASATRVFSRLQDQQLAAANFEQWRKLWRDQDIIFIEGARTRMGVGNDLFSNARSIRRIIGPPEDSFSRYAELLGVASRQDKDCLFILALGPTATVLSFDLAKMGYRALDLGHIDIEYEWFLKGVTNVVVQGKYVNEARGGNVVADFDDESYESQIVYSIQS